MKKIIKLSESDLSRIVKRVVNETKSGPDICGSDKRLVGCGSLGIKSAGCCEKRTKRMVELCSKKFPDHKLYGYCYDDTKKIEQLPLG